MTIRPVGGQLAEWVSVNSARSRMQVPDCLAAIPTSAEGTTQAAPDPMLREVFRDFVAQTLFSEMLRSMRKTLGKPAYFHGGRAEEVFQTELDRILVEKAARQSGDRFSDKMFELFTLRLR